MQAIRGRDVSPKRPPSALRLPRRAAALVGCLALAGALRADEPYRNLRDAELEYHGPAEDFANLTELRLGWFGPSDPADPLAGDAWFAATLALDEANAAARSGTLRVPSAPRNALNTPTPLSPLISSSDGGSGFTPDSSAPRSPSASEPSTLDPRPSTSSELPFRLVPCWAPDPWRAGVSLLARMVYDEEPLALLGSVDSASTHLAEQIVAKAQLPLLSPFTTDKSLTLAGVSWMFTCAPSDAAIASTLVEAVLAAEVSPVAGPRSGSASAPPAIPPSVVAGPPAGSALTPTPGPRSETRNHLLLLSSTDHESRLTSREVMREFSLRKRLPDSRFELTPGLALPPQVLAAFEQSAPTIIVLVTNAEDSARWLITLRERLASRPSAGATVPAFFGSHTLGRTRFRQLAGPAAEGVQFPLLWNPATATPEAGSFIAHFRAARGHAPDYIAVHTYDATRLLVAAIRQAGPNRARIRESLLALSPWSGLAGPIHFDGTGQNTRSALAMGTIRHGVIVPLSAAPAAAQLPPPSP